MTNHDTSVVVELLSSIFMVMSLIPRNNIYLSNYLKVGKIKNGGKGLKL